MSVDNALIFAGGVGKRMGPLSRHLPKPLWPFYGLPVIELQMLLLKRLGISEFFYNVFEQQDLYLQQKDQQCLSNAKLIAEDRVMGQGVSAYRFLKKVSTSLVALCNCEPLLYISKGCFQEMLLLLEKNDVVLLGQEVNKETGFNALDIENQKLKGIIPHQEIKANSTYLTYSGFCLIKREIIDQCSEDPNFFKAIANYHQFDVCVVSSSDNEFCDLGTYEHYVQEVLRFTTTYPQMNTYFKNQSNHFISSQEHETLFNFSGQPLKTKIKSGIILEGRPTKDRGRGVYFQDQFCPY